jgi:hypothetical protein
MAQHVVDALIGEWEREEPTFIEDEIYSTGMYGIFDEAYGDKGFVIEYEAFDEWWKVVIVDNAVEKVIGNLYVCPIVAVMAKAVVMYTYRLSNRKINTSLLDNIIITA